MSDQLTASPGHGEHMAGGHAASWRSTLVPVLIQVAIVLVAFAAAGALCGMLWWHLWTPPKGVVSDHQWFTDEAGLRGEFSSTGLYVLIATVAGLLVGAVTSFFLDRSELATLLAVVVGSALAAWLMVQVGQHYSPADPHELAKTAKDGAKLSGHLFVAGDDRITGLLPAGAQKSAYAAFPLGALSGLAGIFFAAAKRRRKRA